ncbi:ATP-DEPENDENT HELICASE HRQ1, partial [Salix viminalis]
MVQHGLHCIPFCRSRKLTEIVLSYTHEILQKIAPYLVDSICAYRAGYVVEANKEIFSVGNSVATNALEFGVDVGHIDVTLHLGFPGSVA